MLPAVLFAQHSIPLAGLHHDKASLLLSYKQSLLDLDDALLPLIAPYSTTLITTNLLDDARTRIDKQLIETIRILQKKQLVLTWLITELHDKTAQSQLITRSLDKTVSRADSVLSRAIQSHDKLAALQAQVDLINAKLQTSIQALQSCYADSMVFHAELSDIINQQSTQQYILSSYDNALLNLLYGHPIGANSIKSTIKFTPFSSYVPSPVTGTVIAVQHFPGLGFGAVIAQAGRYTLISGLESLEILSGDWVTAGTILGKLHDYASDVLVVSWQKQDIE